MTTTAPEVSGPPGATPAGGQVIGHKHGPGGVPLGLSPSVRSTDPADFATPRGRDEAWRFTPMRRLRGLHETTQAPTGRVEYRSDDDRVSVVAADAVAPSGYRATERPAAVALAGAGTAAHVVIAAGDEAAPVPVRLIVAAEGGTAFGRVHIEVAAHARAIVVLEHIGDAAYIGNVDVVLGDGAELTLTSLQRWSDTAVHLGYQHAVVGRDARFRSVVVTLSGDVVRLLPSVEYAGPGGDAELYGAFFAASGQHQEHRLFVDHEQPNCRSRVTYKGALSGAKTHTVWVGDVVIGAKAIGTDTYELNRNLVLTDGARADSVPNLEILTGEVAGAGHASATGRFDDQQLFYLMSRGIPAAQARRLVVRGFVADIVRHAGVSDVVDSVMETIDERLAQLDADDSTASAAGAGDD